MNMYENNSGVYIAAAGNEFGVYDKRGNRYGWFKTEDEARMCAAGAGMYAAGAGSQIFWDHGEYSDNFAPSRCSDIIL